MAIAPLPAFDDLSLEGERLYREHGRRVLAICTAILRSREEAEDAAQQVFVSAVRALQAGTYPRDAGAWLATIARHECWLRARTQPLTAQLHDDAHELSEDVSATVARREQISALWRAIDGLPPVQREALLLREVRGLDYEELADGLHVSHASARSLLLRARRTVRRQLERGAAVITGAPWLNVVARLFADGQNPTFSAATRTAAIGLGALALTGGAVIAPDVTHRAAPHPAVAVRGTAKRVAARATVPVRAVQAKTEAENAGGANVHRGHPAVRGHRRSHDGSESSGSAGQMREGSTRSDDGSLGHGSGGEGATVSTASSGEGPGGSGPGSSEKTGSSEKNGSSGQGAPEGPGSSDPGQGSRDGDTSPSNVAAEPQSDGGGTATLGDPGPSGAGSGSSGPVGGGSTGGDGGGSSGGGSSGGDSAAGQDAGGTGDSGGSSNGS